MSTGKQETRQEKKPRRLEIRITGTVLAVILLGGLALAAAAYGTVEWYTAKSSFCGGSCHTMTEQYEAWQADTHHGENNDSDIQAECVDCHFLPGEHGSLKAKYEGLRHLAAYLYDKDAPLPIRPDIPDGACLSSGCHDKQKLAEKEIQFTEKVRFKHDVHLGNEMLNGQTLACDTCHMKVTEKKHFEVPGEICYLCHLKLEDHDIESAQMAQVGTQNILEISFANRSETSFNEGDSRCDICHTIPTEPLQRQLTAEETRTKKAITHQTMHEEGVPCESCHFEVVKGSGDVVTGNVVSNGCLRCHNRSDELLAAAEDGELMHNAHVETREADCFDCHISVEHKNRTDHLDSVREDCELCHADQHKYQKILLSGSPVTEDLDATPHLMFEVNTNCLGCHLKKDFRKGHAVRTASAETCVACHTEEHDDMLEDWKNQVTEEIKFIEEYETEVEEAFESARGRLNEDTVHDIEDLLKRGADLLDVVRVGNGVHNKK